MSEERGQLLRVQHFSRMHDSNSSFLFYVEQVETLLIVEMVSFF